VVTTAQDRATPLYALPYVLQSNRTHTKQFPVQLRQTELVITIFVAVPAVSVVAETRGVGVLHVPTPVILTVL